MFKDTFCSSPWFHLRLHYDGSFKECRWSTSGENAVNFKDCGIMEYYNGAQMNQFRQQLLNGEKPDKCSNCYYEDTFGKICGRQRQLLKSGIIKDHFELSLRSSPHFEYFKYSKDNNGESNYYPIDLQIDLGNVCNSACIMCDPMASSKLSSDYAKLNKIEPILFKKPEKYQSWTQDPVLLERFIDEIVNIPNLKYIHFLGGETLYDQAFYKICDRLIAHGISKDIIVGTTTNGTLYDERIETLITSFKEFHLGISIESSTSLNDYIRFPSKIDSVLGNIDKFLNLRKDHNVYISLRVTPNIFTISEIDKLVEYMLEHNVIAESCNILSHPSCLVMELIPEDIRQETISKLKALIKKYNLTKENIINLRVSHSIPKVIADVTFDYLAFLESYQVPDNVEDLRYELVKFLKSFESIRGNSIIDYAPRYKDFLRSYGY